MISKEDIKDLDIVDAVELASIGQVAYRSGDSLVSTTAGTQTITFSSSVHLLYGDDPIEAGDKVVLTGTTAADGTYIVSTIVDDQNLTVVSAILDSTGGTASFYHKVGATRVGVDTSTFSYSSEDNLQNVLSDLDTAIGSVSGGGLTENQHENLDTLVHIIAETHYEEITRTGGLVTSVILWETNAKLKKIREELYTYTLGKVDTITVKQYNGSGVLITNQTLTGTVTRTGGNVTSIDWVQS